MKSHFVIAAVSLLFLAAGCASSADPWREAAHKTLDTGSNVWWDKTRGGW